MADRRRRKSVKRTLRNTKISRAEPKEDVQDCIICLDKVSCRGKLGVCDHWFCFSCILEWSKNTNICPVCKTKFRCISKTHLVPGKSPIRKVRVPDVDQRNHVDDNEFIWAELESNSEIELSDYEPSSNDDAEDETYHVPPNNMVLDTDSETDENKTLQEIDSDMSSCESMSSCKSMSLSDGLSSTTSESSVDDIMYPCTKKKKTRGKPFISDDDDSMFDNTDDEWQLMTNDRTHRGKSTKTNGFIIRQKPQRLSIHKFEEELKRRRQTASRTKEKQTKTTSNTQTRQKTNPRETDSTARQGEEGSTTIGQWLSSSSFSQPTSSRSIYNTRDSTTHRQGRTTNRLRNAESSARMEISNESSPPQSGSSQSRPSQSRPSQSKPPQSRRLQSGSSQSKSSQPVLPKKRNHKKLTFNFYRDSDSDSDSSSGESWMALDQSKKKSKDPDNSRRATNTKRSEQRQRTKRPLQVFKELQNFFED